MAWRFACGIVPFIAVGFVGVPGRGKRIGFPQPSSKIDLLATLATKRSEFKFARLEQPLAGRAVDGRHKPSHRESIDR
jgi:hypothetical protein